MLRILSNWKASTNRLLRDLEEAPSGPRFRFVRWVVIPLLILAVLTAFGRFTGFDLGAEKAIYRAGGNSWSFGESGFWKFLYNNGSALAAVSVILSFVGFLLSWSTERFRKWRRAFLFAPLFLMISSGVIVNGILKEHWGRPRPKQLLVFGGHQEFEPVLTYDPSSKGKSFPCGHATTGFFFLGGFFLLRRHRKGLARGFLAFGLIFGVLMGLARMTQGGHFFTDVVWTGAICWFTAMGLYYALKLDRSLIGRYSDKPMPFWLKITTFVLGAGMIAGILLASPYRDKRDLFIVDEFAKSGNLDLNMVFAVGNVTIEKGEKFKITGEAWGHGVPTSFIKEYFVVDKVSAASRVVYAEDISGWFRELESNLEVRVPWQRLRKLLIRTGDASVELNVPVFVGERALWVGKGNADLKVLLHGQAIELKSGDSAKLKNLDGTDYHGDGDKTKGAIILEITDDFEGNIVISSVE